MMKKYRYDSALVQVALLLLLGTMPAMGASGDPPARVARLAQLAGTVSLEPAGTNEWTQALVNTPLTTGARLYVDHDGHAELEMEQIAVRAWRYTDLTIANLTNTVTQLGLAQGSLHIRTFGLGADSQVEIDTPNGAITVVQPGDVRIDAYTSDGGTLVTVRSGEVQVSGAGVAKFLGAGQAVHLVGSNPITVLSQRMPGEDPFDVWNQQRDRVYLSSQARRHVNPNTIGSDDLDQYGTWTESNDDGPVWYPAGVPAGWVPYSTGHWGWISPWGWTWVDTSPWGFAPFHYGRWVHAGSRWGWIPGPLGVAPIYSPANVGFVSGTGFSTGGVSLAAWFPLGPGEPFYPWYFCSPGYFTQLNLTNIRGIGPLYKNIDTGNYYRYFHQRVVFQRMRFVNRTIGTIAIPAEEFAAGHVITPATAVRPTAQQLAHEQMIPHPSVAPAQTSVVPRPVNTVPVPAERPAFVTSREPQPANPSGTTATSEPPPVPLNSYGGRSPLIARTPPPPESPSFAQREAAFSLDPGRPLDPGQLSNLSRGRGAGAAAMPEFPPHPGAAVGTQSGGSSRER